MSMRCSRSEFVSTALARPSSTAADCQSVDSRRRSATEYCIWVQSYWRTVLTKVKTAGDSLLPEIETKQTSRQTSGSTTGLDSTPGYTALNSGMKQMPSPSSAQYIPAC